MSYNLPRLRFYRAFYKGAMALNFGCAFIFAFAATMVPGNLLPGSVSAESFPEILCRYFAIGIMTAGPLAVFAHKELTRPSEYFYYYNQGISKIKLFVCCLSVNILPATLALILKHYVASA